jgi:hypothetical protein
MSLLPFGFTRDDPGASAMRLPTPVVFEPLAPQKWAYHLVTVDTRERNLLDEAELTALGAEGWLLASVLVLPGKPDAPYIAYHFVRAS